MTAETLREAARLMRNRAAAADGGPWKWAEQTHGEWYGIHSDYAALGTMHSPSNAFYVASMDPTVALAVAEWITAHLDTHSPTTYDCDWTDRYVAGGECAALAVARAYLGETS